MCLRACRPGPKQQIPNPNPVIQDPGGGIYASPLPPPRLRLAGLLAVVPRELGCQSVVKPTKNQHFRHHAVQGATIPAKSVPRSSQDGPRRSQDHLKRLQDGLKTVPRSPETVSRGPKTTTRGPKTAPRGPSRETPPYSEWNE